MNWISYLLTVGAGLANPVQSGANAQLKKSLDEPIWSMIAVYLTGLLALLLIEAVVRHRLPSSDAAAGVPWWAWMGGVISLGSTMTGLVFAQKMGSGVFTGISVTSAIVSSILLDHFGLIGFKQHSASLVRILGGGLMIVGLWLVAKF